MFSAKITKAAFKKLDTEVKKTRVGHVEIKATDEWAEILDKYVVAHSRGGELGFAELIVANETHRVRVVSVHFIESDKDDGVYDIGVKMGY